MRNVLRVMVLINLFTLVCTSAFAADAPAVPAAGASAAKALQFFGLLICFGIIKAISAKSTSTLQPSGIGGWLTFFLTVTLYSSILGFFLNSLSLLQLHDLFESEDSLAWTVTYGLCAIAFNITFIYAVYSMCQIRPNAVSFMKKLLIVNLIYTIAAPAAFVLCLYLTVPSVTLTPQYFSIMYNNVTLFSIATTVIRFAILFPYLSFSRRIKNTWA